LSNFYHHIQLTDSFLDYWFFRGFLKFSPGYTVVISSKYPRRVAHIFKSKYCGKCWTIFVTST